MKSADKDYICDRQMGEDGPGWRCPFNCAADGCPATGDAILDGMASSFVLGQQKNRKKFLADIKTYDRRAKMLFGRHREAEEKRLRKQADADAADAADAQAAGGGSAPLSKLFGKDYEDGRQANIARNMAQLETLGLIEEKQKLHNCGEGQTAVSKREKQCKGATAASGASMQTRRTAATEKEEAAAALEALHKAEVVGGGKSAATEAPNAKAPPKADADAEADVEPEPDADAEADVEPEPDAKAIDATVSTHFELEGRAVVRSPTRLAGIPGFLHYKTFGVLFMGVQIADSRSMPKGVVCGVLVRDDLQEGFIIVRPSMEGDIYLQALDLLLVQKGEGLVDVHGAPNFLNKKNQKKHLTTLNKEWGIWCLRGTTQREAFDRRYADGDILR